MSNLKVTRLLGKHKNSLHINKKKGYIKSCLGVFSYADKDTNQFVSYIPSLEISGYGSTKSEAFEMMNEVLEEYFDSLIKTSDEKINSELSSLGWLHSKIRRKDYSKAYIDISGNLKDFAVNEIVEQEMLQAV